MIIRNKKTGEIKEVSMNELNQYGLGGQHGGLDRWFAEKWVDIKTGEPCGRQEGENRNYPACRPSKRISSDTPKTASELSSAEKQKFKQEKTSSQRISYNHNRKEYGGENINLEMMKSGGNVPTNPSLWSRAKAAARSKYDVYPSAYANGFAAKWYKSHGGGWKKAEYGMEVMGNGGVPTNSGFVALPEYVQQNIINNMATGGQKMPPQLAYARFAAAGNLNQLGRYGYQDGGDIPTIEGPSGYMNEDNVWIVDNETIKRQAQELGAKKVLTEGGSLIIFDDNWNIVAADDNPDAPYKQGGSVTLNTGGENHRIYVKTTNRGEGKKGHIMVNHPTMDKGMWDTIDLTQKSGATTIAQGVAATKKWHKENPYMKEYGGDVPMYGPGGFVAKPTASDSLAVMNFQIALNKFYENEVKKGRLIKKEPERFSNFSEAKYLNDDNLNFYRTQIKTREENKKSGYPQTGTWDDLYKSFFNLNPFDVSKLEYQGLGKTKSGDANKKYYRDLITPRQNLAAPFALVDTRIKPQHVLNYESTDPFYPGGVVSVYDYDPIAVKPAAMKTAADWAYMQKTYGTKPPATTTPKPTTTKTVITTKDKVTTSVRPKYNLKKLKFTMRPLDIPKVVPHGELLPIPQMTLPQQGTIPFYGPGNTIIGYTDDNRQFYPLQYSGAKNNQVNLQDKELLANPELLKKYVQSKDNYKFAEGGGIPERYRNMGFTNVGAKKQSTRPGKKWMVLAKKGNDYKVVHGGYKGMQDFKQHHSEQRKENFWSRMGGRNSSKATDPFSPLYWHKRFGTWEYGGQPMAVGGQNVMNPIVKKDNRNWLEYLKN